MNLIHALIESIKCNTSKLFLFFVHVRNMGSVKHLVVIQLKIERRSKMTTNDHQNENPIKHDWRTDFANRPYYGDIQREIRDVEYDQDLRAAYELGQHARNQYPKESRFEELENDLKLKWNEVKAESRLKWEHAKLAIKDAWERV